MRRLPDLVIVAVLVVLVAVPLVAGSGVDGAGTDAVAADRIVADEGYQPWVEPVATPSSEVESGLFALQAAIGAGVLGYALGALRERTRRRGAPARAD